MKRVFTIIFAVLCIALLMVPFSALGAEMNTYGVGQLSDMSERLNITVSDTCSGHDYFYQIAATEQGSFIIVSRYTDIKEKMDLVYKQCFVDVYSQEGMLLAEISFYTEQDFVAELVNNTVKLYFYDHIILYDYITCDLYSYTTAPGESVENGTFDWLKRTSFSLGDWQYNCKKGFHGYSQLTRTKDNVEQTISFDGNRFIWRNTLLPGIISGGTIFAILLFAKTKLKKKTN